MHGFRVQTLIDITETNQYRKEPGRELVLSQQQNFQMLIQTIGMRVNPTYSKSPKVVPLDVTGIFGSQYRGIHRVWIFDFFIEYELGLADSQGNPCGLLEQDLHLVPIITKLTESINIHMPVFNTTSTMTRNTIINER